MTRRRGDTVQQQGIKRFLAFGACATVAAVLVVRILPELTVGLEEELETDKARAEIELSVASAPEALSDTLSEAPSETPLQAERSAVASLLLPPPPALPEASQVAPQPETRPAQSKQPFLAETAPPLEKEITPPPKPEAVPQLLEPELAPETKKEIEDKQENEPESLAEIEKAPLPEEIPAPAPIKPVSKVTVVTGESPTQVEIEDSVLSKPIAEVKIEARPAAPVKREARDDEPKPSPDRAAAKKVADLAPKKLAPKLGRELKPGEARLQAKRERRANSDSSPAPSKPLEEDVRPAVDVVAPGTTVEAEGRVLLRILEHGSGPEIEIAWPVSGIQRRALYRLFEACYGMEIAMLDSSGRLFGRTGKSGQAWRPNMDRYSGFVRQPAGRLTRDEKNSLAHIRALHGGLRGASNVRLFPRRLDAMLLGGLKTLVGEGYEGAAAIRAHYRRDGNIVLVESIRLDGRPILGRIDLSSAARRCRSDSWS